MDDSRVVIATVGGAVVGAVVGYLLFTERGRALRRQLEPALEDFSRELHSFRDTVQRAAGVASEGWQLINDAIGDASSQAPRYPTSHQSSPF